MQKTIGKITSIQTALPKYKYKQDDLSRWMHKRYDEEDERLRRRLSILYKKSKIKNRYSVLPDFGVEPAEAILFKEGRNEPAVEERLKIYRQEALPLAKSAALKTLTYSPFEATEITHLITVSCTGMSAPGLEFSLKNDLNLKESTNCFAINFVGCYAVFPALKMADAFCKADSNAKVLIVSVELCTLHFQNKVEEDHLLSNALFADGAASCIVCSEKLIPAKGFLIKQFHHLLLPNGSEDMAWNIHSSGFLMKLSSYVPELVNHGVPELLNRMKHQNVETQAKIDHWAIHPGGNSILEKIKAALGLQAVALIHSLKTMKNYGNLSAPTILFVLKSMLEDENCLNGQTAFALGFGPGLTLDGALLQIDGKQI